MWSRISSFQCTIKLIKIITSILKWNQFFYYKIIIFSSLENWVGCYCIKDVYNALCSLFLGIISLFSLYQGNVLIITLHIYTNFFIQILGYWLQSKDSLKKTNIIYLKYLNKNNNGTFIPRSLVICHFKYLTIIIIR